MGCGQREPREKPSNERQLELSASRSNVRSIVVLGSESNHGPPCIGRLALLPPLSDADLFLFS